MPNSFKWFVSSMGGGIALGRAPTLAIATFFVLVFAVASAGRTEEAQAFRLKDGSTMVASDIQNHNRKVDIRMRQAMKKMDAARAQNAHNNVSLMIKYVQNGNREKLRSMMRQMSKLNKYARQDIEFYLKQTPAGTYIVACDDGEAMTWWDAYAVGLGALIESEMIAPSK